MVGGFLGAGKTTALLRLAEHLTGQGRRVGLITNDQSYGLVDTTLVGSHGYPVEEITGGCFCGAVRYRVKGATRDVSHCHCGICRRTSGAPFVTWATFPAARFAFTSGTPAELHSTPRAVRQFCAACGTALTFRETARPGSVDVTVGSMDRPDAIVPAAHIWTASQLSWLRLGDDLPRHVGEDPEERDVGP